jgi:hypothetical protein
MPKPIQIKGKDYFVNVAVVRGNTASGDVNFFVELYDEEPSFVNGEASVEPVEMIQGFGDAGTLYYQLKGALETCGVKKLRSTGARSGVGPVMPRRLGESLHPSRDPELWLQLAHRARAGRRL